MHKFIHTKTLKLLAATLPVCAILLYSGVAFADSVKYSAPYSENATGYKLDGDVTVNVNVAEINALEMTLSTNNLIIDLAPHIGAPSFDTDTLNILVGTTNATGYTLTMTSSYDGTETTSLTRTESISGANPTIDSIENSLTPTDFASSSNTNSLNKWGYLLSATNLDIDKTFYNPILTINTINSSTEPVYNDPTSITFGAKVNSELPAGNYRATLKFTAVANYVPMTFARAYDIAGKSKTEYNGEEYYTMQDMNSNICSVVDNLEAETLIDARDNNTYSVAKIGNDCWMNQNLRIKGTISAEGSNFIGDDIALVEKGPSYFIYSNNSNLYDLAINDSGNANDGVYYAYSAATAGTIVGANNQSEQIYDICPSQWQLPKNSQIDAVVDANGAGVWQPSLSGRVCYSCENNRTDDAHWGSEVDNSDGNGAILRHTLAYDDTHIYAKEHGTDFLRFRDYRRYAHTVRCVAK